jgi:hypothetical protein
MCYRYGKVGLIDGSGNTISALVSAVQLLGSFLSQSTPPTLLPKDQLTFKQPHTSCVLVNCVFGQSRSITVVALYLYYTHRFATLQEAIDWVKLRRKLDGDPSKPQRDVLSLAVRVLKRYPTMTFD